jgi:thiol-disulfide isomerase/thioredoxin
MHVNSSKAAVSTQVVTPSASATIATPTPSAIPTTYSSPSAGGSAGFSVLYFWLENCSHCAALSNSYSFNQLKNTVPVTPIESKSPQTSQYGVSEWPTLILLKNGVEVQRFVGNEDATAILARINAGY